MQGLREQGIVWDALLMVPSEVSVKRFRITLEGKTFEVVVENPYANPVRVMVDGETFEIPLESLDETAPVAQDERTPPQEIKQVNSKVAAVHILKSPMPGTINKVFVQPGDWVEHGQELIVLEAMKMNNVIRATAPGRVEQVRVVEKQSVQHGDVLIVFGD